MRSTTAPAPALDALRRTVCGLAAAGLLVAGALALGTPAHAATPVPAPAAPALAGPVVTAVHPYPAQGAPRPARVETRVEVPERADGGSDGPYTVTFDLGGLAGVANVAFEADTTFEADATFERGAAFEADGAFATDVAAFEISATFERDAVLERNEGPVRCAVTGTRAVCHGTRLRPGSTPLPALLVTAARGSANGASATVRITGEARGLAFTPFTTRITVGGPDLVMKELPLRRHLTPGETQPVALTFANTGSRAAHGVLLTLGYTRGIAFTERYENCVYTEDAADRDFPVETTAVCAVEGDFEAGVTYTLAEPLTLRATAHAYQDTFRYGVEEGGPGATAAPATTARAAPGARGNVLALAALPAPRSADLTPGDNQRETDFTTTNTADLVAYGDLAEAGAGGTVETEIGVRNRGPAWIGDIATERPVAEIDFTLPEGAEAVRHPAACRRDTAADAPRYVCAAPSAVREDGVVALPFTLRITDAAEGATGTVAVHATGMPDMPPPFDPDPANNTATVVLDALGAGAPGGPGGGTDGSGTTGPAPTASSGTGGPAPAASTSAPTATPGPRPAAGTGRLAATGTDPRPAALLAGAALSAGGALYAAARAARRKAGPRRPWSLPF
ncbi:peptidase [Streptomyces sp. NPDC001478]